METNQKMTIEFSRGEIDFTHKDGMGDLTQTFTLGNMYRVTNKSPSLDFHNFMNTKRTKDFIKELGLFLNVPENEIIKHNGKKGRNSKTYANLHFLIYCAEYLSPRFHIEVIDTFITQKVLDFRDIGGDEFKELNSLIDNLEDRVGKNNKGCYIQIAKQIREKVFGLNVIHNILIDEGLKNSNVWNSKLATGEKQALRAKYEAELTLIMKRRYVRTYPILKIALLEME